VPQGSRMETAAQGVEHGRRKRQYRTAEEKRRIVEATLSPDVSVAIVARRHGVNANQVFHWRKLYEAGMLGSSSDQPQGSRGVRLLPVTVEDEPMGIEQQENKLAAASAGSINIEFPGRALVSVEGSPDPAVVRAVIESLRG
jgi:transposase